MDTQVVLTTINDHGQAVFHSFVIKTTELIANSNVISEAFKIQSCVISIIFTFDYTDIIDNIIKHILNGEDLIDRYIVDENTSNNLVTACLNENGKFILASATTNEILNAILILDRLDLKHHIVSLLEYIHSERNTNHEDFVKYLYVNRLSEAKLYA